MFKLPERFPPSVIGFFIIAAFVIGILLGYWLCANQAKVNAAAVVLEDVLVSIGIREKHVVQKDRIEDLKDAPELKLLDACYTDDLPFNFDSSLQPDVDD